MQNLKKKIMTLGILFIVVASLSLSKCVVKTDEENVLKIGGSLEPKTLNPLAAESSENWYVLRMIYNGGLLEQRGLYMFSPVSLEMIPYLADGMPEYDDATNTAIVKLKKGVKWHDGVEFTAEDVKFTLDLFAEFNVANYLVTIFDVEKIEVVDPHTLKFYLTTKSAYFYYKTLMTLILPKHQWESVVEEARKSDAPERYVFDYQNENPVGLGPYKLAEYKRGSYVLLEKDPNWFFKDYEVSMGNGKTLKYDLKADKILMNFYASQSAAVLALQKGEIDVTTMEIRAGFIEDIEADPDLTVSTENSRAFTRFIGFNFRREPYSDSAFRAALHYIIDKDYIENVILEGYGSSADSMVSRELTNWYNPNLPKYGIGLTEAERMTQAMELLKNAGYSWEKEPVIENGTVVAGEGLILPSGEKMGRMEFLTYSPEVGPHEFQTGSAIMGWWKKLGIDVYQNPVEFGAMLNKVYWDNDFDAVLFEMQNELYPLQLHYYYDIDEIYQYGWNMMAYVNEEYERLADEWIGMIDDPGAAKTRAFELQAIIAQDNPTIPLYDEKIIQVMNTSRWTGWIEQYDGPVNWHSLCSVDPVSEEKPTTTAPPTTAAEEGMSTTTIAGVVIVILIIIIVAYYVTKKK
ncbi:MAG: ABC transporter substrate-binding protein [Methanomicrobia archaeon]|nr:ABC transporter substrate-binding protein [Methanomicrobia archaeon]